MATAKKDWTDETLVTAWECSGCNKATLEDVDMGAPEYCAQCGAEFTSIDTGNDDDQK